MVRGRSGGSGARHEVLIVGGGPTGLMLAAELSIAGVDVAIVERRESQSVEGSRAGGLHPRSLELLDQRGVAERFIAQGKAHPVVLFPGAMLDTSDLATRHSYWLALWQERIERTLAAWVDELSVPVLRGAEVTGVEQQGASVAVGLSDGRSLEASHVVGCDGGRSLVRRQVGIELAGFEASVSYLIAECEVSGEPAWGVRYGARGIHAVGRLDDGPRVRLVVSEPEVRRGEPTVDELREALRAAYGSDFGVHGVTWLSRFSDAARQAVSYRAGRVLLAGDAAHVHSPTGGQGLNLGLHDAVNLGWKLARVVKRMAPEALIDTYHTEQHPVAARVLKATMAHTALNRGDPQTTALRESMAEVMRLDEPRRRYASMLSGLDVRHDLGPGHPLRGRRMPDLDLVTEGGPRRLFTLLHRGQGVLLVLGGDVLFDEAAWRGSVLRCDALCGGPWVLPVVGEVAAPSAVLVRPDGHVAWVGEGDGHGLGEALTRWFGEPAPR